MRKVWNEVVSAIYDYASLHDGREIEIDDVL